MEQILYACLILLPFGVSLQMSLRLLYGARGPQVGDPVHLVVSVAGWTLTILPLIAFIVVGTTWLSWFVLAITAIFGLEFLLARRAMQRRSVWELLTGTVGSIRPEVQSLQTQQARFTGIVGRAYRKLVASLERGTNLRQAIGDNRRAVPEEAQAYAAIDVVSDEASPTQNAAIVLRHTRDSDAWINILGQQLYQRYAYLFTLLMVMVTVLAFLTIKIIPSFQAIFQDFEVELPLVTQWLIWITGAFTGFGPAAIGTLLLILVLLGLLFIGVLYLCDVHALRPITDRWFFSRHRSLILRLFAIAAERGQSFQELLRRLVDGELRYPSSVAIHRLQQARQRMLEGTDWKTALQSASIIKAADIPMLETAQQSGNLPWVLRMLADQKTRSMIFRWSAVEKVVFPLQVALIGIVVLFICVALFLPLVQLIHSLA